VIVKIVKKNTEGFFLILLIMIGASVLGLNKLLMYRFWYGYVKERYGDKRLRIYTRIWQKD